MSRGRTIVLTIHSPSAKIFHLFDRLILLTPWTNGAKVAYQGPAEGVLEHFDQIERPLSRRVETGGTQREDQAHPSRISVADQLMQLLQRRTRKEAREEIELAKQSQGQDQPEASPLSTALDVLHHEDSPELEAEIDAVLAEDSRRIDSIVALYNANPDRMPESLIPSSSSSSSSSGASGHGVKAFHPGSSTSLPWVQQFRHLTHRSYLTLTREVTQLHARLFTNLFLAFFPGLLYLSADRSAESTNYNQTSVFNRVGFIFFVTCMVALVTLVSAVLTCQWDSDIAETTQQTPTWTRAWILMYASCFCFLLLLFSLLVSVVQSPKSAPSSSASARLACTARVRTTSRSWSWSSRSTRR